MEVTFVKQATSVDLIEKAHMLMWNVSFSTVLLWLFLSDVSVFLLGASVLTEVQKKVLTSKPCYIRKLLSALICIHCFECIKRN